MIAGPCDFQQLSFRCDPAVAGHSDRGPQAAAGACFSTWDRGALHKAPGVSVISAKGTATLALNGCGNRLGWQNVFAESNLPSHGLLFTHNVTASSFV